MRSYPFALLALVLLVAGMAACSDSDGNQQPSTNGGDSEEVAGERPGGAGSVTQDQGSVAEVAAEAGPSVVRVGVNCPGGQANACAGTGSGWLYDDEGHFVTNNHVVTMAGQQPEPLNVLLTTLSGRVVEATVIGRDPQTDLAVLQADVDGIEPLPLANLEDHQIGDPVVAIGYALDLGSAPSVTAGVISAKQRQIVEAATQIYGLVQTDAAINPGNSGGPLLDLDGNVVGVNTATIQAAEGIGFAIGSDTVRAVADEIIDQGSVDRGFMGIAFQDVTPGLAEELDLPVEQGIRIERVERGSPAEQAGLQQGDIITKVAGEDIRFASDLTIVLTRQAPGGEVEVEYYRGDERETADVTLGRRP